MRSIFFNSTLVSLPGENIITKTPNKQNKKATNQRSFWFVKTGQTPPKEQKNIKALRCIFPSRLLIKKKKQLQEDNEFLLLEDKTKVFRIKKPNKKSIPAAVN